MSAPVSERSASIDFIEVLKKGLPVFGIQQGCEEWRSARTHKQSDDLSDEEPDDNDEDADSTDPGLTDSPNMEEDYTDDIQRSEEKSTESTLVDEGVLRAVRPDAEGRVFSFSYHLYRHEGLRMRILGRGGYTYEPGKLVLDPEQPGYARIGTGSYCAVDVSVRDKRGVADVVLVGEETWFLSRDACVAADRAHLKGPPGCGAGNRGPHLSR